VAQRSWFELTQTRIPTTTVTMYWKITLDGTGALATPKIGGMYGTPNTTRR
jgi:hypothetical protein